MGFLAVGDFRNYVSEPHAQVGVLAIGFETLLVLYSGLSFG
jgi:hypothetical protein